MFEKKIKSVNPPDVAVAEEAKKINLAKRRPKRDAGEKHRVDNVVPKWYPGRINPSHEGMIW
ncbi:hypothetical protein [Parapedobacter sp.]